MVLIEGTGKTLAGCSNCVTSPSNVVPAQQDHYLPHGAPLDHHDRLMRDPQNRTYLGLCCAGWMLGNEALHPLFFVSGWPVHLVPPEPIDHRRGALPHAVQRMRSDSSDK